MEKHAKGIKLFFILTFIVILCTIIVISGCSTQNPYNPSRHQYQVADRVVLSKADSIEDASYLSLPEDALLLSSVASDAIIIGSVQDSGTVITRPLSESTAGLFYTTTTYQVQVLDVWYGDMDQNEMELLIRGDLETAVTKPLKDDVLVLFLRKYEDDSPYQLATGDELSMYAINPPDNILYSFSDAPDTTVFDNQSENSLKKAIKSKLKEFKKLTHYTSRIGRMGEQYLSPELSALFYGDSSSP